jgi:NitT/TauT family transport system substrate-binding protein
MQNKSLRAIVAALILSAGAHAARAAEVTLRVGVSSASSDAVFYIADKKGYFRQEGLAVSFTPFDSAARMVAPLGAGQLDVGGGSPSAGLYNAVERGIDHQDRRRQGLDPDRLRLPAAAGAQGPGR